MLEILYDTPKAAGEATQATLHASNELLSPYPNLGPCTVTQEHWAPVVSWLWDEPFVECETRHTGRYSSLSYGLCRVVMSRSLSTLKCVRDLDICRTSYAAWQYLRLQPCPVSHSYLGVSKSTYFFLRPPAVPESDRTSNSAAMWPSQNSNEWVVTSCCCAGANAPPPSLARFQIRRRRLENGRARKPGTLVKFLLLAPLRVV